MSPDLRLEDSYIPSPPCACETCRSYCKRPGWWTVEQASFALDTGYGNKMMLEIAPDFSFAVLSPAFKGCEGSIAINDYSKAGCNFYINELCELHGTDIQPLECQVCHHDRPGLGPKCHLEIEKQWNSSEGQEIIVKWMKQTNFWDKLSNDPNAFEESTRSLRQNKK